MLVKSEAECPSFVANDGCSIRELIHPRNDRIDAPFSLAIAEVARGASTYRHRLAQTEVYYILDGNGRVHVGDDARDVRAGDAVFIPPHALQWIDNTGAGTLRFAAIVAPPWRAEDDERM